MELLPLTSVIFSLLAGPLHVGRPASNVEGCIPDLYTVQHIVEDLEEEPLINPFDKPKEENS